MKEFNTNNININKLKVKVIEGGIYGLHEDGYAINMKTKQQVFTVPGSASLIKHLLDANTDYSKMNTPKSLPYKIWKQMSVKERQYFAWNALTVDHIIPTNKGGGDELSNLQWLEGPLNSSKSDKLITGDTIEE